jgi:glycosyltransferase involved in cell wall biosynthesis
MTTRLTMLVDSPSRRAHGNAASRLAIGLAQTRRVEPTLLCYGTDPAPPWLPADVTVRRVGADRVTRSLPPLVRYLQAEQPDVLVTRQVHANFVGLAAAALARIGRRWHGKLVLVQDHPIELSHASNWRDNKWLAKLSYRFADGLISPSPAVLRDAMAWCGFDQRRAAVVPNPIPAFSSDLGAAPHPWLADGEPPVFVHTSNMTSWKRLDLLVDAFADVLKAHEVRLLIVGDGPGRSGVAERIQSLRLASHAQTVGWVEDPRQFAARAWAFALASDEEGFAQVLTEAMSVGCPVVATDAAGGGPRFVTDDGRCGLLVPTGDRRSLAEAMTRMLEPGVRAKYSRLGCERAGTFSPLACGTALADFLRDQLGLPA